MDRTVVRDVCGREHVHDGDRGTPSLFAGTSPIASDHHLCVGEEVLDDVRARDMANGVEGEHDVWVVPPEHARDISKVYPPSETTDVAPMHDSLRRGEFRRDNGMDNESVWKRSYRVRVGSNGTRGVSSNGL